MLPVFTMYSFRIIVCTRPLASKGSVATKDKGTVINTRLPRLIDQGLQLIYSRLFAKIDVSRIRTDALQPAHRATFLAVTIDCSALRTDLYPYAHLLLHILSKAGGSAMHSRDSNPFHISHKPTQASILFPLTQSRTAQATTPYVKMYTLES